MIVDKKSLILEIDLLDAIIESMQKCARSYPDINYSYLLHLSGLLKIEASRVDDMILKLYEAEVEETNSDEEE